MFTDYNYFLNVQLMITLSYYIAKYHDYFMITYEQ